MSEIIRFDLFISVSDARITSYLRVLSGIKLKTNAFRMYFRISCHAVNIGGGVIYNLIQLSSQSSEYL